jgi:integrase
VGRQARSANKYQALLSVLMSYAILKRMRTDNPCRDVRKLKEKPRKRLMSDDEQVKISAAALEGRRCNGTGKAWKNANGEMYAALFDFAYLTALRLKDVRLLQWSNVGETEILIEPTKTRDSSGAKIAVEITPDIKAVLERARAIAPA